jgi:hypothetical protein
MRENEAGAKQDHNSNARNGELREPTNNKMNQPTKQALPLYYFLCFVEARHQAAQLD